MSIEYIKGNLLDFPGGINVIGHCVNARGVMGSGIALQIKEEYPIAYEVYRKAFEAGDLKLGSLSAAQLPNGKRIINICGQANYGLEKRQVDYEAIYAGFEGVKVILEQAHAEGRTYTLGLPYKIASDRAGGAWLIIEAMLKYLFEASPIKLVIVEYTKR